MFTGYVSGGPGFSVYSAASGGFSASATFFQLNLSAGLGGRVSRKVSVLGLVHGSLIFGSGGSVVVPMLLGAGVMVDFTRYFSLVGGAGVSLLLIPSGPVLLGPGGLVGGYIPFGDLPVGALLSLSVHAGYFSSGFSTATTTAANFSAGIAARF